MLRKRTVFHKDAFEKTSEVRREKVLNVAVLEFAERGFAGTNINVIAEKAGISIGAMYSYFASKEDLFLSIVSRQLDLVEDVLAEIDVEQQFFDVIREMFVQVMEKTREYPYLSQIYLDITTQSMSSLSQRLMNQFEAGVSDFLLKVVEKGKARGDLPESVDANMLAYNIDNLLIIFQFSFSSEYYAERMRFFLGDERGNDTEYQINSMVKFIENCAK
ncbi:TetR/AcrR family transcriptional regulator [Teredinibacter turnerae]|uniref:TetR/AcrR family transcriptional regulator n=1 Tax=Teredinibacter turnerae TaxID=2426 RepID=UPI0005F8670A|nr:TetR/AcrR family transcriptional regulator [Teredinibacter turnerae]